MEFLLRDIIVGKIHLKEVDILVHAQADPELSAASYADFLKILGVIQRAVLREFFHVVLEEHKDPRVIL